MSDDWSHPEWPVEHRPRIESAQIGARVTCTCGWSTTAKSAPRATRAFVAHVREAKEGDES